MKEIELTKGKVAIVDDEDYEKYSKYNWHCVGGLYAARSVGGARNKRMEYLHRLITEAKDGEVVDHINRSKLDNRKSNLRLITQTENTYNKGMNTRNKSGYTGVSWHKEGQKWSLELNKQGKKHYMGLFENKHEAARIYNMWATDIFGKHVKLNDINDKKWEVVI